MGVVVESLNGVFHLDMSLQVDVLCSLVIAEVTGVRLLIRVFCPDVQLQETVPCCSKFTLSTSEHFIYIDPCVSYHAHFECLRLGEGFAILFTLAALSPI